MRVLAICLVAGVCGGCKFSPGSSDGGLHDMVMTGPRPLAVVSATPAPAGLPSVVDGSQSSDKLHRTLVYAWHVASVPAGSKVSDAAITTPASPTVSFASDVGGAYSIALTVTTPDGQTDTATTTVTVPTLPIFFRRARLTADTDSFVAGVVRSDGSGAHAIGCAVDVADPSHGDAADGNRSNYGDTPGALGLRSFDGVNGAPAKVVYEDVTPSAHMLWASDENGDCTAHPPTRLDATPAAQHLFPRFSPDGTRVAWLDLGSKTQLYSAAVDGSERHVVRANAAKMGNAPPVWIDATHLAWVENVSATKTPHLTIVQGPDSAGGGDGAMATGLLDCDPSADASALQVIDQFAFSAGTLVVAGGTTSRTAQPPGATILYAMASGSCSTTAAAALATEPGGGYAWDFDLAPDGSAIVFSATSGQPGSDQDIYRVLLGATPSPPSRFGGSQAGVDDVGPRFIAGGRQLAWTRAVDDASGGGIVVANYDGATTRTVLPAQDDGGARVTVISGGNRGLDCNAGGGRSTLADALVIMGALCLLRRRRRLMTIR
jgi:hypothetical protein